MFLDNFKRITKACTKCEQELPVKNFNKNRTTKSGLQDWCKPCLKAYQEKRRQDKTITQKQIADIKKNLLAVAEIVNGL